MKRTEAKRGAVLTGWQRDENRREAAWRSHERLHEVFRHGGTPLENIQQPEAQQPSLRLPSIALTLRRTCVMIDACHNE